MGKAMSLPHPHELAALGAVLCLYRIHAGSELAGWSRAVRVSSDSALDSDGLCESLQFFDRDGLCCWRLYLLPDTDFLAWERLLAGMPAQPRQPDHGPGLRERLWRRVARHLGGPAWRANVLRFHAPPAGPGFAGQSLLAASLPPLSACGAEVGRRIVRREGIEDAGLVDDCCFRQATVHATTAPVRGGMPGHPGASNTSEWA
ncbi:MAG TPA: Hemin transport protein [Thermomonas sp.]|nr:Hemin transport protein [Thermomonas sp.]